MALLSHGHAPASQCPKIKSTAIVKRSV